MTSPTRRRTAKTQTEKTESEGKTCACFFISDDLLYDVECASSK